MKVKSAGCRVAVLMGGTTAEREVSLDTGRGVAEALASKGYRVVEVDLSADELPEFDADVAFIALHGGYGEGGGVQRDLEAKGIPYTGSCPEGSRRALDKGLSKEIFKRDGIPTPDYRLFSRDESAAASTAAEMFGAPVVIKPAAEGSSVGVTIVESPREIETAFAAAAEFGEFILVEKFIPGRLLEAGILGGACLPLIQVLPKRRFYDYSAKYEDARTEYIVAPDLPAGAYEKVKSVSIAAHTALGCRCFSRVDVILGEEGVPYVLEVNTIPGLTASSLLPKAAKAAGYDYADLVELMVEMALER